MLALFRESIRNAERLDNGQAVLALASLGGAWEVIRPSVDWLLKTQGKNGGWNFPGTDEGHERLIYTFYPALVIARFRKRLGKRATSALRRISAFKDCCDERDNPWWLPLRKQLGRVTAHGGRNRPAMGDATSMVAYWELFEEEQWGTIRIDDDWMPERFSMAAIRGANYLHLRHIILPDHPLSLLHIRYFVDERKQNGWSDKDEDKPKTWATALGALTLDRWAFDLSRAGISIKRLPTRAELLTKQRNGSRPIPLTSPAAKSLLRRIARLGPGTAHAAKYQHWVRDVFTFLFGEVLKEPKVEVKTFFDTLRRDITFRNAAERGPWFDWKLQYKIDRFS